MISNSFLDENIFKIEVNMTDEGVREVTEGGQPGQGGGRHDWGREELENRGPVSGDGCCSPLADFYQVGIWAKRCPVFQLF